MDKSLSEFDQLAELFSNGLHLYLNWAKQKGLSANEFFVFYQLGTVGSCTQKAIADEWEIPKQTVSVVCKNLLQQGLIQYEQGVNDKREKSISLTESGEQIALPLVAELSEIEQRTAKEFGTKEFAHLIKQLNALLTLFEKNLAI